jgi:D-xylose transport system permease protein
MSSVADGPTIATPKTSVHHAMNTQYVLEALAGKWRMVPVLIVLAVIWAYFYSANPLFLSPRNLSNLSLQIVVTGTLALGLMFVLVIGEIDLSVAAVGAVSAAIAAGLAVNSGVDATLAIALGLLTGGLIGGVQGVIVTIFRAPAFIVTLGVSMILQGVLLDLLPPGSNLISLVGQPMGTIFSLYMPPLASYAILAGVVVIFAVLCLQTHVTRVSRSIVSNLGTSVIVPVVLLAVVGTATVLVFDAYRGVPVMVAFLLCLLGVFAYITTQTRFGLHLFAVGANAEAVRRSGISVNGLKITAFVLTGMFAALAGMMAAGRVLGVSPDSADTTLLLEAIAAAVIGGVSLFGGRGSVWAALTGALVMGSVSNGMLLINATTQTRLEVQGAILVLAVVLDALLSRRATRR